LTDLADAEQLGTRKHEGLEFKRDLSSRDPIRRSICALANGLPDRSAGTLLIGIEDDGQPTKIAIDDDLLITGDPVVGHHVRPDAVSTVP
jgi:ATP-dependent DNA helicase RecG